MKYKKSLFAFLFALMLISTAVAYMPPTHKYLHDRLEDLGLVGQPLYDDCFYDSDLCYAGNILSDFSLTYGYYGTEGGQKYLVTHEAAFCESMLQLSSNAEERSCAVGACLHGLTQDLQSHTQMVTHAISRTGLPNSVIHTFAEQHLDNIVQKRDPGIKQQALDVSRFDECRPIFKRVVNGFDIYKSDVSDGTFDRNWEKFLDEVSGSITSYDISFRKKGTIFDNVKSIPLGILAIYTLVMLTLILSFFLLLFRKGKTKTNYATMVLLLVFIIPLVWVFIANLQGNAFVTFVKIISPISNLVPIGDPDLHLSVPLENGKQFFLQGEAAIIGLDGSGFAELAAADKKVLLIDYALLGVLAVLLYLLVKANLKKKKNGATFDL